MATANLTTDRRLCCLMSLQRALLGAVTPELRAVGVDWSSDCIVIHAYFDQAISDEARELTNEVETEVMADFPPEVEVRMVCLRLDAPGQIEFMGLPAWAFSRHEQ